MFKIARHTMNTGKSFLILFLFALGALAVQAQPNKKVGPALSKFLNTEFMLKFRDMRISAESAALSVQSNHENLQQSDVFKLRSAYDQTASRANQILENIKQDFLNPKKMKSIADFPEMYSDGLRYKLQELADFYTANFQQVLADASVKPEQVDGSAVLLLVVELIGLTKGLTNYFGEVKREARQYTEAHLQENLVQPHRWRYWDELTGSVSPYEKFDKSSELNMMQDSRSNEQFNMQLQKLNETISTLPQGNSNSGNEWNGNSNSGSNSNSYSPPPPATEPPPQDTTATFRYDDWSPTQAPADPASPKAKPGQNVKPEKMPAAKTTQPADKTKKAADKPDQ